MQWRNASEARPSGLAPEERLQVWVGSGIFALLLAVAAATRGVTWHLVAMPVWLGAMHLHIRGRRAYRDQHLGPALGWAAGAVVLGVGAVALLVG